MILLIIDGEKGDMKFEPWMLAAMDEAGYNGIEERHIKKVASNLSESQRDAFSMSDFRKACVEEGIESENFTQKDIERLKRELEEYKRG